MEVAGITGIPTETQSDVHDMLVAVKNESEGLVLIHCVDESEDSFYSD